MATETRKDSPPQHPVKEPGLLQKLLWNWPWAIIGVLLLSLLFSLLTEFVGMAFFWPEQGAQHSRIVMETELGYLSQDFTRSLLSSAPVETFTRWINVAFDWLFVKSGFLAWLGKAQNQSIGGPAFLQDINVVGAELSGWLREGLSAAVNVTVIFLVRVTILVLSIPLFVLVLAVGAVDGLVRRDLRRYGAGYESSFLYHHAKRFVKPVTTIPCILYLSVPVAVYPNLLILPAALGLGLAVSVTMGAFKKYL